MTVILFLVTLKYWPAIGNLTLVVFAIWLLTTILGIYLFTIGRGRTWKLQVENEILAKRIEQFMLKDKLNALIEGPDEI